MFDLLPSTEHDKPSAIFPAILLTNIKYCEGNAPQSGGPSNVNNSIGRYETGITQDIFMNIVGNSRPVSRITDDIQHFKYFFVIPYNNVNEKQVIDIPLSDTDWRRVSHFFERTTTGPQQGRPRRNLRQLLDAVLWIIVNGEKWHHLPSTFPPQQTCYAKWLQWKRVGVLDSTLRGWRSAMLLREPANSC